MKLEEKIKDLLKDSGPENKEIVEKTIQWFLDKAKSSNTANLPNNWRTKIEKLIHPGGPGEN